jgi:NAD-dependent deacetylase
LRPAVVLFGEMLPEPAIEAAFSAARQAEVVLVVGTSSVVYPAAALPEAARFAGAFVIEVNPEETPLTALAHASLRGPAATVVPDLLEMA